MNALPDSFLSATNPVSCNRYTESVIIDAFGAVSPGYSPEMHLSHDRVTEREHNQWRNGEHLRPLQSQVSGFQVGICKRVGTWWQSGFVPPRTRSPRSVGVEGVCYACQASPKHMLDCLGLTKQDLYENLLIASDLLRVSEIMDLVFVDMEMSTTNNRLP
ncbi:hypothetical protein TNCV_3148081 [Trichonephila clavipes]|nr:hypothetical protein TNCV_3148081 [Trichonephila clavipes]